MRDFREYDIWHEGHKLVLTIYKLVADFPKEEKFGIISQICRASVSIPNNIAEGCGRNSDKQFASFLNIAAGSCSEVEYLLILSTDLGFATGNDTSKLIAEVKVLRKRIYNLMQKLDSSL